MYSNSNPAEDWRALTEHYRSMSDEQLCELAEAFTDLTPTAQQVLRDEMKLRKLGDPQATDWGWRPEQQHPAASLQAPPAGATVEYTWKTVLAECDTYAEAWQLAEMLRQAGIDRWIEGPSTYASSSGSEHAAMDAGSQRVLVAADQLDQAQMIAARPIPPDIVEQSRMTVPEYELPKCPRCGTADPILESADPVNAWSCESCGAEWQDEPVEGVPEL